MVTGGLTRAAGDRAAKMLNVLAKAAEGIATAERQQQRQGNNGQQSFLHHAKSANYQGIKIKRGNPMTPPL